MKFVNFAICLSLIAGCGPKPEPVEPEPEIVEDEPEPEPPDDGMMIEGITGTLSQTDVNNAVADIMESLRAAR